MARASRPPPGTAFVLRTLIAFSLALYVAYALELDSPASAATTVLIVSASSRGAVLAKGFWRIVGSVVGAVAAVGLIAAFAQAPLLFVVGLALWLGLCTSVSSLLRYFRSYGAVLAGYTVVLVAVGAIAEPDNIFRLACSRVAVVTIGVVASGVVSMATDIGPTRAELAAMLGGLIADAARLLPRAAPPEAGAAFPAARGRVAASLTSLDQTVEFAAVDDAGFSRFAADIRLAAAELFAALTGGPRAMTLLAEAAARHRPLAPAAGEVTALLTRIAEAPDLAAQAAALERALADGRAALLHAAGAQTDPPARAALDQAAALLGQMRVALDVLGAMHRGIPRPAPGRLAAYVNPRTALRNGVRACLAVLIAGVFWIDSSWSSGGTMLAALGPITGLLAQADSAAKASIGFLRGMLLAVLAAFVCGFGLLPQISGFPLLLAAMLPFVLAGLIATLFPRGAGLATPFLIFFVTLTGPTNPMRYDLTGWVNTALAFVLGASCGVLTFRVLLPPDPAAEAAFLARSVRADVLRLARATPGQDALRWEHLQHQKMVRLGRRLAAMPARRGAAIEACGGAVLIGRRLRDIATLARTTILPRTAVAAIAAVRHALRHDRARLAAELARRGAEDIAAQERQFFAPHPAALAAAACLHDLGALLARHGGFLDGTAWPDGKAAPRGEQPR